MTDPGFGSVANPYVESPFERIVSVNWPSTKYVLVELSSAYSLGSSFGDLALEVRDAPPFSSVPWDLNSYPDDPDYSRVTSGTLDESLYKNDALYYAGHGGASITALGGQGPAWFDYYWISPGDDDDPFLGASPQQIYPWFSIPISGIRELVGNDGSVLGQFLQTEFGNPVNIITSPIAYVIANFNSPFTGNIIDIVQQASQTPVGVPGLGSVSYGQPLPAGGSIIVSRDPHDPAHQIYAGSSPLSFGSAPTFGGFVSSTDFQRQTEVTPSAPPNSTIKITCYSGGSFTAVTIPGVGQVIANPTGHVVWTETLTPFPDDFTAKKIASFDANGLVNT